MIQMEHQHLRSHRALDGEMAALLGIGGGDGRGLPMSGVRGLMLAMLEDAVRSYLGSLPRCREEAEAWIESRQSLWVFSFSTVCETLGLEPPAVRVALRRMRLESPTGRGFMVAKSRPNARQANLRITLPRVRRRGARRSRRASPAAPPEALLGRRLGARRAAAIDAVSALTDSPASPLLPLGLRRRRRFLGAAFPPVLLPPRPPAPVRPPTRRATSRARPCESTSTSLNIFSRVTRRGDPGGRAKPSDFSAFSSTSRLIQRVGSLPLRRPITETI